MRTGELTINGKDAATTWGVFMSDGALSALMTPAPMKAYIENESRAKNGKEVLGTSARIDSRDLTLTFCLKAPTRELFFTRYLAFVEELQKGTIAISTQYQPNVIYRCLYVSCSQFSQYNGRLGKFSLRLTEPNPANRS